MLNSQIKQQIIELLDSQIDQNREYCGVVVENQAVLLTNTHDNPQQNFCLSPHELADYENIQAIWHNHWSEAHPGYLTYPDIRTAQQAQTPIIMFHSQFSTWDYYEPNNPNPFPLSQPDFDPKDINSYVGWTSHWGRSDCFALVRCFYLGMYGIDMGEFTRPNLDNFPPDDYDCPWEGSSFSTISKHDQINAYDAVGIALKGGLKANHAGIVLPDNMLLHAPSVGHFSKIEMYGKYWFNRTVYVKRIISDT